jgi:hypothetical protein
LKIKFLPYIVFVILSGQGCSKSSSNNASPIANSKKLKTYKTNYGYTVNFYYSNGFILDSTVQTYSGNSDLYVKKYTYNGSLIQTEKSYNIKNNVIDLSSVKIDTFKYIGDSITNKPTWLNSTYIFSNKNLVQEVFNSSNPNDVSDYSYDTKENPYYLILGYTKIITQSISTDVYINVSANNVVKLNYLRNNVINFTILYNNLDMPYEVRDQSNNNLVASFEYY